MNRLGFGLVLATLLAVGVAPAGAAPLLLNGDFETGTFASWTVDNGGSGNWFVDTPGTTTPFSGHTTSAAGGDPHGSWYAVSDQTGAGTHGLRQSFTVAAGSTVHLSFDMFVNNYDGTVGNTALDHTGGPVEHGRVDILTAGATAFDTGAGVVQNVYDGFDAGANPHPFTHYDFDITAAVGGGGTFQVRFAESDNQSFFNMGIDNVSIDAVSGVPEPASLVTLAIGVAGLMGYTWRRRKQTAPVDC